MPQGAVTRARLDQERRTIDGRLRQRIGDQLLDTLPPLRIDTRVLHATNGFSCSSRQAILPRWRKSVKPSRPLVPPASGVPGEAVATSGQNYGVQGIAYSSDEFAAGVVGH